MQIPSSDDNWWQLCVHLSDDMGCYNRAVTVWFRRRAYTCVYHPKVNYYEIKTYDTDRSKLEEITTWIDSYNREMAQENNRFARAKHSTTEGWKSIKPFQLATYTIRSKEEVEYKISKKDWVKQ